MRKMSLSAFSVMLVGILSVGMLIWTTFFSNVMMLAMEHDNFIPAESSIFSFDPYEINQGSSSYWIYGQDRENYYYFSYESTAPYIFIPKVNKCQGFDRLNFKTWCDAKRGRRK